MFESLTIQETSTYSVVTASLDGNPFSIKAVLGVTDGVFTGASFIEVFLNGSIIDAQASCSSYGVEHRYSGEGAALLTELCEKMSSDIEEQFGIKFLVRDEPQESVEPTPPTEVGAGEGAE